MIRTGSLVPWVLAWLLSWCTTADELQAQTVAIPADAPWADALGQSLVQAQAESDGDRGWALAQEVRIVPCEAPPTDPGTILFGWPEYSLLDPKLAPRCLPLDRLQAVGSPGEVAADPGGPSPRNYTLVLLEAWVFWCPRSIAPAGWVGESTRGPGFGTVWEWALFASPPVFRLGIPEPESAPTFWHGVRAASIAENARAQNDDAAWLWLRGLDRASLLYATDLQALEKSLLDGDINLAPLPVTRGLRLPRDYVALCDAESTPAKGYGLALVGTGASMRAPGATDPWSTESERVLEWLTSRGLLDRLAGSVPFGLVRAPRHLDRAPDGERARWLAALKSVQPDPEADRGFAEQFAQRVRGRGESARWVGTAFDILFAVVFVAFIIYVKRRLDREDEGSPSVPSLNSSAEGPTQAGDDRND